MIQVKRLIIFLLCSCMFIGYTPTLVFAEQELFGYDAAAFDQSARVSQTAQEHNMSEWVVTESATCSETGLKERYCMDDGCDYYETKVLKASGHDYEDAVKEPDCTKGGYTSHCCTYCGDYYVDGYVSALGHDMSAWIEDGDNWERRDCSRCDYFETRTVTIDAPTIKVSIVASSGKPRLTWKAVAGATGYEVYRATSENGTYTLLSTTGNTILTNTSTEAGTTYYYKVCSIGANGSKSEWSNIVSQTCILPRPVVTVSNVASSGKPRLIWKVVAGASGYEVYRATSENGTYTLLSTTGNTILTNTSTEPGVTYYYKVRALHSNSSANSEYSAILSRTCNLPKPAVTVSNVASSGKPRLIWKAVAGASGYEVYRATSENGTYTLLSTTGNTILTNTSTEPGVTYYYKVRALHSNSSANSEYSAILSRTCNLPRPTLTLSLNSSGKPKLSWTKIDGAVKYQVYRATSADGTYTLLKTTTGTSLTNTSVTAGTTYYYKVCAVHSNSGANSAYSTVKSVTAK